MIVVCVSFGSSELLDFDLTWHPTGGWQKTAPGHMEAQWEPCYSVINLLSFLNWLTYVAAPEEAEDALKFGIRWHRHPTTSMTHCHWDPGVWIPQKEGGRQYVAMTSSMCAERLCWRCHSGAGGFAFCWQSTKWTPRCAILAPNWADEATSRKEFLKVVAYELANKAPFPFGAHKAAVDAEWGWDTGYEMDGQEYVFFKRDHTMGVKFVETSTMQRWYAEIGCGRLPKSKTAVQCVTFKHLIGQPRPRTRPNPNLRNVNSGDDDEDGQ